MNLKQSAIDYANVNNNFYPTKKILIKLSYIKKKHQKKTHSL